MEDKMERLILTFDEMASLRSFMLSTILETFDCIEMESMGHIKFHQIIYTSEKIRSILNESVKEYIDAFNKCDYEVIISCIVYGNMGLGIYNKFKSHIDYGNCDFSKTLDKLYRYINEIALPSN